jgi:hypothetical protein
MGWAHTAVDDDDDDAVISEMEGERQNPLMSEWRGGGENTFTYAHICIGCAFI